MHVDAAAAAAGAAAAYSGSTYVKSSLFVCRTDETCQICNGNKRISVRGNQYDARSRSSGYAHITVLRCIVHNNTV